MHYVIKRIARSVIREEFQDDESSWGSYLIMRGLKGVESMSSRRLLIEPRGAVYEGSLPTRDTSGRAMCLCGIGESEGLECASNDMVV